jgi:hypothetical protein
MRAINARDTLTAREREEFEQEKTIAELQAGYQLELKSLEVDLKRIEVRWTQLFRLPFAILTLPVRLVFAFAYIAHAICGTKPDDNFWDYTKHL